MQLCDVYILLYAFLLQSLVMTRSVLILLKQIKFKEAILKLIVDHWANLAMPTYK